MYTTDDSVQPGTFSPEFSAEQGAFTTKEEDSTEDTPVKPRTSQKFRETYPAHIVAHMEDCYQEDKSKQTNLVIENAMGNVYTGEQRRSDTIIRHNDHFTKFVTVYQCLSILLDTDLLELAIFGMSRVRIATNFLSHRPNVNDKHFAEALKRVEELVRIHEEETLDETKFNERFAKEVVKLAKLTSGSKDYFYRKEPNLELAINDYLKLQMYNAEHEASNLQADGTSRAVPSDIHVLMSWFESFNPVRPAGRV